MQKLKLGVFFGGVSVEHEVSIITGLQLIKNVDHSKYEVVPVYLDKTGRWWTGEPALTLEFFKTADLFAPVGLQPFVLDLNQPHTPQLDVALLCFHGTSGESGAVQGALELARIPFQGPQVLSSAIGFDKVVTRQILATEKIGQTAYEWFTRTDWKNDQPSVLAKINQLNFPVFVKPANSGSSIGIKRAKDATEVVAAIEFALQFDDRILVEAAVTDCIEVNVSVLGDQAMAVASVAEQPISADEFLSFADKYQRGGGKKSGMASATRRIPAPISNQTLQLLQATALKAFKIFDCSGVVRIDFFVNPSTNQIFLTELNTIPGSMSFYLWEASGMPYLKLIDRLVEIALDRAQNRRQQLRSFETNLLQTAKI